MSSHFGRRLFVTNLSNNHFGLFVNHSGAIQKNFSGDCIFFNSRVAVSCAEKAMERFPMLNFQPEILPNCIIPSVFKRFDFWKAITVNGLALQGWYNRKKPLFDFYGKKITAQRLLADWENHFDKMERVPDDEEL